MRSLDRRVIYLLALLVVVVPLLSPFGLPLAISPEVKQAYDALLALPPGTRVLVSVDYDPRLGAPSRSRTKCSSHEGREGSNDHFLS